MTVIGGEMLDAITQATATVVEHDGRITGYATAVGFFAHSVGEGSGSSVLGARRPYQLEG